MEPARCGTPGGRRNPAEAAQSRTLSLSGSTERPFRASTSSPRTSAENQRTAPRERERSSSHFPTFGGPSRAADFFLLSEGLQLPLPTGAGPGYQSSPLRSPQRRLAAWHILAHAAPLGETGAPSEPGSVSRTQWLCSRSGAAVLRPSARGPDFSRDSLLFAYLCHNDMASKLRTVLPA